MFLSLIASTKVHIVVHFLPSNIPEACYKTNITKRQAIKIFKMTFDDAKFLAMAFEEAEAGYNEGGIPV
jgi:hypothetical protein